MFVKCLTGKFQERYVLLTLLPLLSTPCVAWQLAEGPLMTRWAVDISADNALPEYPRPQMTRDNWLNLNGLWDYAITPVDSVKPQKFDGDILVPYPVESALSGVMKRVSKDDRLWYRRKFSVPQGWSGQRILLHFGAVDWEATVTVNGRSAGVHRGGYDPFTFDITDLLNKSGLQEIVVSVFDPTDDGKQARGKQVKKPYGCRYTPVTGIWQTVWLEPVAKKYIQSLKITPNIDQSIVEIAVNTAGETKDDMGCAVSAVILADGKVVAKAKTSDTNMIVRIPKADLKLWSPDSPFLYDLKVSVKRGEEILDSVSSYFGMRKIAIGPDKANVQRLWLNNEVLFQYGLLDQGWWPNGLYTAPTDAALRYDVEVTKQLGFNMARKHVKVEPARWYYWCDKLGLLVWQDMPNANIGGNKKETKKQFETELKAMMDSLYNVPSIVMWVPFNEGWGQYDTERITKWVKKHDPSRLVNNASGFHDKNIGDVLDVHHYPGPNKPVNEPHRAGVLGEFGGLGLPIKGYAWQDSKNWSYRAYKSREELTKAYVRLLEKLRSQIPQGLSAAIYTQTSDVEGEVNGMMTYDRDMIKPDADQVLKANESLFRPPVITRTIIPISQEQPKLWGYTTDKPAAGWEKPEFNDSNWKIGPGVFGNKIRGIINRTKWDSDDIWIRRTFEIDEPLSGEGTLKLITFYNEDAEVYINGILAAKLDGPSPCYLFESINQEAAKSLKPGENTIAVHCHKVHSQQAVDVGIAQIVDPLK